MVKISENKIVKIWQKANTPLEAAKKLKINLTTLKARVVVMRKHKIPLQKFSRHYNKWTPERVKELQALAKKFAR